MLRRLAVITCTLLASAWTGVALAAATDSVLPTVTRAEHIRGRMSAPVTIIEYADFECPFCKRQHPELKKLLRAERRTVRWVYRHFPLAIHSNAVSSAIASECAKEVGGRGMFWSFADSLMEKSKFTTNDYATIAGTLGLDKTRFNECIKSGRQEAKVTKQSDGGQAAAVRGTPTLFLVHKNGKMRMLEGMQTVEQLREAIEELGAAGKN